MRASMSIMSEEGRMTVAELTEFVSKINASKEGDETVTLKATVSFGGKIKTLTAEFGD